MDGFLFCLHSRLFAEDVYFVYEMLNGLKFCFSRFWTG